MDEGKQQIVLTQGSESSQGATITSVVLVSSTAHYAGRYEESILTNVLCLPYVYEKAKLTDLQDLLVERLGDHHVSRLAFVVESSPKELFLTGSDNMALSTETVLECEPIRSFFTHLLLSRLTIDTESSVDSQSGRNSRNGSQTGLSIDFISCQTSEFVDGGMIKGALEDLLNGNLPTVMMSVNLTKPLFSSAHSEYPQDHWSVCERYFNVKSLFNHQKHSTQLSLSAFEKIRTVGKGAYGAAVLYRKKDDDSLVILKEINMHDLNATERQMALNEVKVLSLLQHTNIIRYIDSFEEDGLLMIEMEYADGGTLAQYLASQMNPIAEREIVSMFQQIVSAISHIHGHNILHRDLKTANIFLTKDLVIKVGDFGISKVVSTSKGASTVLGTPYYISPEMCEGKSYNNKSDVWALGCILYEMACLQRTFEGSNLPALVHKIMKGQFAPVRGKYSDQFKQMVKLMLELESTKRPSCPELLSDFIPELLKKAAPSQAKESSSSSTALSGGSSSSHNTRTALYFMDTSTVMLTPHDLPPKLQIQTMAVGRFHTLIVSSELSVYSMGTGSHGELGHESFEKVKIPRLIHGLKDKAVTSVCCGEGFSVFGCNNGIVITCGNGSEGCLGHGDYRTIAKPKLIEALLHVDVVSVSSGPQHVVVVGSLGEVYSWGIGRNGRLGQGNTESCCTPQKVDIDETVNVRKVICGPDGTILLTDVGGALAFGNNDHNKLGLNKRVGFLAMLKNAFRKTEVPEVTVPTMIRELSSYRIRDASLGQVHTAVLTESGQVLTFGRNIEGQLGSGTTKVEENAVFVKLLGDVPVSSVVCAPKFTVVLPAYRGGLYLWGTKSIKDTSHSTPPVRSQSQLSVSSVDGLTTGSDSFASEAIITGTSPITSPRLALPPTRSLSNPVPERSETDFSGTEGSSGRLLITPDSSSRSKLSPSDCFVAVHSRENSITDVESIDSFAGGNVTLKRPSTPSMTSAGSIMPLPSAGGLSVTKDELLLVLTQLLNLDSADAEKATLGGISLQGENIYLWIDTTAPSSTPSSRAGSGRRSMSATKHRRSTSDYTRQASGLSVTSSGDIYRSVSAVETRRSVSVVETHRSGGSVASSSTPSDIVTVVSPLSVAASGELGETDVPTWIRDELDIARELEPDTVAETRTRRADHSQGFRSPDSSITTSSAQPSSGVISHTPNPSVSASGLKQVDYLPANSPAGVQALSLIDLNKITPPVEADSSHFVIPRSSNSGRKRRVASVSPQPPRQVATPGGVQEIPPTARSGWTNEESSDGMIGRLSTSGAEDNLESTTHGSSDGRNMVAGRGGNYALPDAVQDYEEHGRTALYADGDDFVVHRRLKSSSDKSDRSRKRVRKTSKGSEAENRATPDTGTEISSQGELPIVQERDAAMEQKITSLSSVIETQQRIIEESAQQMEKLRKQMEEMQQSPRKEEVNSARKSSICSIM